jgi:Protein tyrosine/serine phosphatase
MNKKRWVLQSTCNTRDLGGYRTEDGRVTGCHMVRSDCFQPLTLKDQQTLIEKGVNCSIDLRSAEECENVVDVFRSHDAVAYHHIPLMSDELLKRSDEVMMNTEGYLFFMGDVYQNILDIQQQELRQVFQTMLAYPTGHTLYHCSAGKDRTGVVSALLLLLAGVSEADVIDDYALTSDMLQTMRARFREELKGKLPDDRIDQVMGAPAENMRKMIDYLNEKWGGVRAYLDQIGLDATSQDELKDLMFDAE